jgi:hypothetical protein
MCLCNNDDILEASRPYKHSHYAEIDEYCTKEVFYTKGGAQQIAINSGA